MGLARRLKLKAFCMVPRPWYSKFAASVEVEGLGAFAQFHGFSGFRLQVEVEGLWAFARDPAVGAVVLLPGWKLKALEPLAGTVSLPFRWNFEGPGALPKRPPISRRSCRRRLKRAT